MTTPTERLVLRRTYDAPRERVFRAWTTAEELARWYSPDDAWTVTVLALDPRVGGGGRFAFGPAGEEPWIETVEYLEIDAPRRLVFRMTLARGGTVASETTCTVELIERGGQTELVLTDEGPGADEHASGWGPALDHLTSALRG
jgi:uncharacterized protein YndB with AHSA1/START domain